MSSHVPFTPYKWSSPRLIRRGSSILSIAAAACLAWLAPSCHRSDQNGTLHVAAAAPGTFDVYRIESESPLQFVSEQVGQYNENISLHPGHYLIMADCSSETVVILPSQTQTLAAHTVNFIPPVKPSANDKFSIQCTRFEKTRSRQNIKDRFTLHLIGDARDLLVGMVPLQITMGTGSSGEAKTLNYELSALQVGSDEEKQVHDIPYFVSPVNAPSPFTEPQRFGERQFLLPGNYVVEVNGTRMKVELAKSEDRIIRPAFLKVSTSPEVDLVASSRITGNPMFVDINRGHWLNLNETYALLPGTAHLNLNNSTEGLDVELKENELLEIKARSVTVTLDCPPTDHMCLGSRDVMLFMPERPYPYVQGVTDVPVLFFENNVLLSIGSSLDIRYKLSNNHRDLKIKVGKIRIVPQLAFRPGVVTDLVRVESRGEHFSGVSLDIPLDAPSTMVLVEGTYALAQYVTTGGTEGERHQTAESFHVSANSSQEFTFTAYATEKVFRAYSEKKKTESNKARQ